MEKLDKNTGIDENLRKGLEATEQVSVEKLEAGLKEKQEQAFSGAKKKKEEIWQQIKDEVKRVEEGVGDTRGTEEEVAEAKQGGEDLKNKGAEAEGELKSTIDIVMGKYKTEETAATPEKKLKPTDTVTYEDILKERTQKAAEKEAEQKAGTEKSKDEIVEEQKENILGITEKRVEARKLQGELENARKSFALVEKNDPKYAEAQKDYLAKKEAMQGVAYEARKRTLESKGLLNRETSEYKKLTSEEVQAELDKYTKEVIVPNFAVAEAAKIQATRSEANPSLLEKMKDNKFSKLAYGAVDMYRKANWKKKMALSFGLLGVGVAFGATGGTVGLALAGIVTGGKGIQRFLSGAGTAVATEALIQRSQQKWMKKEGWGKDRHEYIAKQIASMRESAKKGGALSEAEIEKSLSEREEIEKSNEARRAVLAGITGALVGSGAAWQAVKQVGEWTGASGVLGTAKDYWFGKAPKAPLGQDIAGKGAEKALPLPEEPVNLNIGARGPQGALLDEFKKNPELAKKFFGGDVTTEELGAKVHLLWEDQAKQALANPETLAEMKKLGFPLNEEGYAKMAHRISKGILQIDPTGKNIKFADMEYLKNVTKAAKTLLGAEVKAPVVELTPEVPAIVRDLVDQQALSEIESKMTPHIEEIIKGLKENGMSEEKITERMEFIAKAAAERAGVDLSTLGKDVINVEALQKIMDSPGGKIEGFISKLPQIEQEILKSDIEKMGGWAEFLKTPASSLRSFWQEESGMSFEIQKFGALLVESRIPSTMLDNKHMIKGTVKDLIEAISSKDIFNGTAEDIIEGKIK